VGTELAQARATASRRREIGALTVLTLLFFGGYAAYSISRYATYLAAGYDLGIFDQAVRAYSHFRAPIVPLKGPGYNVLGDHFHPIIAVIAPLYRVWNSPCMLLLVQSALTAGTIPVVFRFTRRRTGRAVSLVICAAFGIGWAVQAMLDFDFHEIAFALPLAALAIDALDRCDDRQLLIAAGLLLAVREDMGVLLVVLGLLRLAPPAHARRRKLDHPARRSWPGVTLVVAGLVGYYLATSVIIPAFASNNHFAYWQYTELGPNLPAALGSMATHPWHAISLFFSPSVKAQSLAYLLVPLALVPLRSRYSWLALPLLAERYYNSRPELWTTHYHYSALPWLILVMAMVDGADRLGIFSRRVHRVALVAWLLVVPVWLTAFGTSAPSDLRRMLDGSAWRGSAHTSAQRAVVARLPRDACVAVDDHLAPHLTRRDHVSLADGQLGTADFVALDLNYDSIGGNGGPPPGKVLAEVEARRYRVVFTAERLVLLQSPGYTGPSAPCGPLGPGK
jgi:uncharacterized membrane protein